MPKRIQAIKGTQDVLPPYGDTLRTLENTLLSIAHNYGYSEIRTPVFEPTELFSRGMGGTTDVVQKEMYTFEDKGGRSITLRPEGTAGVVRALLEHGLFNEPMPQKLSYITSCYRYEKPQAGRYREFHQFGVECFGASGPAVDAELIALAAGIFRTLGLTALRLELNSIGCPSCRPAYHAALKKYFAARQDELCPACLERLERNPLRILDCKSPVCAAIAEDAPIGLDYLCGACAEHFDGLKSTLDALEMAYSVNPRIVRGLDYYTKTVFEFVTDTIGAQGTVCGGGRYDGLVTELGGNALPALGFGLGLERLELVLRASGKKTPLPPPCTLYIVPIGEDALCKAAALCEKLRTKGIHAQFDVVGRSVKAQMKYAGKIGALYTAVLGTDDLSAGTVAVKRMADGETQAIALADFVEAFYAKILGCFNHF
ncbi:MAG: histidine--tRNA ligase [Oscillospiraceae bacterium]|jgi:histidyl-tRNA synthetase|nr:histidine--tRNA ligase [Oscillospiraceae bacterium]